MSQPTPDPEVANEAPAENAVTGYDVEHLATYLRLLDADANGADWSEVARIVLHIDSAREAELHAAPGKAI